MLKNVMASPSLVSSIRPSGESIVAKVEVIGIKIMGLLPLAIAAPSGILTTGVSDLDNLGALFEDSLEDLADLHKLLGTDRQRWR